LDGNAERGSRWVERGKRWEDQRGNGEGGWLAEEGRLLVWGDTKKGGR